MERPATLYLGLGLVLSDGGLVGLGGGGSGSGSGSGRGFGNEEDGDSGQCERYRNPWEDGEETD